MATKRVTSKGTYRTEINKIIKKLQAKKALRVGFLESAKYPDGTSVAMVGAIQNFGAPAVGIPPRPFFTNMVRVESPSWPGKLALYLKQNKMDAGVALQLLGEDIEGALRESIIDTNEPPLSAITVMIRGMKSQNPSLKVTKKTVGIAAKRVAAGKTNYGASTKPLIDSGDMLSKVDSEVL